MKNTQHPLILIFALSLLIMMPRFSQAQEEKTEERLSKYYVTTGGEMIFSMARLKVNGNEEEAIMRFSPVFNFQSFVHFNNGNGTGFMTGLTFRNIGLIYKVPETDIRLKARTYNIGIPFAFKLGNMNSSFVYGGYEIEMPLNYKEKRFVNEKKEEKFDVWFSDRINKFQHGFFVGMQLPHGANIKFKYYLTKFYNKNYSERDGQGVIVHPYAGIDASIFYISLDFSLLKDDRFYYSRKKTDQLSARR